MKLFNPKPTPLTSDEIVTALKLLGDIYRNTGYDEEIRQPAAMLITHLIADRVRVLKPNGLLPSGTLLRICSICGSLAINTSDETKKAAAVMLGKHIMGSNSWELMIADVTRNKMIRETVKHHRTGGLN